MHEDDVAEAAFWKQVLVLSLITVPETSFVIHPQVRREQWRDDHDERAAAGGAPDAAFYLQLPPFPPQPCHY